MEWLAKKDINNDIVNNLMKIPLESNQFTNGGINVKLLENFIQN